MTAARAVLASVIVALSLTCTAAAKEFKPGDVRICDASRCVPVDSPSVLSVLAPFYYDSARPPARAHSPRLGAPFFRLEFSDGYISGIITGADLGRFLSYGVNLDQFKAGAWYQVPIRAAAGLKRLSVDLAPLRLMQASLTPTDTFAARGPRSGTAHRLSSGPRGQANHVPGTVVVMVLAVVTVASLVAIRRRRLVGSRRSSLLRR